MTLSFDQYQEAAHKTTRGHDKPNEIFHLVLGLVGETGEIAEKFKKLVRDKESDLAKLDKNDIAKELGDVLWYLAILSDFLGVSLDKVASNNIEKLADRQSRGVIGGSGDSR